MRKARPGSMVVRRFTQARLGAAIGAPARCAPLGIADARAAGVCLALQAFAETGGWIGVAAQAARRVGLKSKRRGKRKDQRRAKSESRAKCEARGAVVGGAACHSKGCAWVVEKTDGSRGLFFFVTWVIGLGKEVAGRKEFPNEKGGSSKVVFRDQNGAGKTRSRIIKPFKISGLHGKARARSLVTLLHTSSRGHVSDHGLMKGAKRGGRGLLSTSF